MKSDNPKVRVSVVQEQVPLFDKGASVEKILEHLEAAAREGTQLVLFPEAFISGYPRGMDFGTVVGSRSPEGRELWRRLWEGAVGVPGPEVRKIAEYTGRLKIYAAVGMVERDPDTRGTLYCSLVYFGPGGQILGRHRKLKPTGAERFIWGEGNGDSLLVLDTGLGRIGGLICWENYMPLARMALYRYGVEIYLAPTADCRDTWISSLVHIACEGRCYVLGSNQVTPNEVENKESQSCRGGSVIIDPLGRILQGPLFHQSGVLTADLDLWEVRRARFDFDVAGHYHRPDVFQFQVRGQPPPITIP